MTEPTRDALRTLAWREDDARTHGCSGEADDYAHAAACVRRVPELEAEVERMRAVGAMLADALQGVLADNRDCGDPWAECPLQDAFKSYHPVAQALAAYAAATREGTDNG